jgi:predicted phage terminase large subunit-like protein
MSKFSDHAVANAAQRKHLILFVQRCFMTLHPRGHFIPNWHIEAMIYQLERVRRGEINRLIINLPPRYLKSIVVSIAFAAFILGHDPTAKIFGISYSDALTRDISLKFRSIIESDWFRETFPDLEFDRILDEEVTTTQYGFRKAVSVFGSLTGMGGDYFIVDDPMKPTDALSDVSRERVNQWYANVLFSRLNDKARGAIIIVMQRLHLHDICGFLTDSHDDFEILDLAAIAERDERIQIGPDRFHDRKAGEALCPAFESLVTLEEIRRTLGSVLFAAQYQQKPVPDGGAMIKRDWFRYYDKLPERKYGSKIVLSWDTATKGGTHNAFSVCTVWLVQDKNYYLMDLFRGQLDFPELRAKAIALARRYDPTDILIEDASTGAPLAAELKAAGITRVRLIKVNTDKEARLAVEAAKFEDGLVHFPRNAAFMPVLEAELLSFPQSRTKDQVDSISQALAYKFSTYTLDYVS